jgi:hypothetical protein
MVLLLGVAIFLLFSKIEAILSGDPWGSGVALFHVRLFSFPDLRMDKNEPKCLPR